MNPKHPIYIVSKGRWEQRLTSRALERYGVPYFIVVEPQEYDQYCAVIDKTKVLILDMKYKENYDACDDLGNTKSKGPGGARNFAWDHSISLGYPWHWVMDDNIRRFYRHNKNKHYPVGDGTIFRCMEDFVERYDNVAMAGPDYTFAFPQGRKYPPYILNTRIYSCNLIRNDVPFRWRGRYNEDTDLSLRMLKAGWCTIQFCAFLQGKVATQTMFGGNTAEFYAHEGTLPKSQMQVKLHPDVSRLTFRFGRWHHYVDYSPFSANRLRRKPGIDIKQEIDDYGMKIIKANEEIDAKD